MSQQINLVNESLRKQKEFLTSVTLPYVLGAALLLFCLMSAYVWQQTSRLATERAEWAMRAEQARVAMTRASQQFPIRQQSPLLQAEIRNAEEKIQSRDRVFRLLESGVVGRTQGFSPLLEAFARQGVQGVWLTRVEVNAKGERMSLGGKALSADLIPQYITRLSAEPALRGRHFTAFQVGVPKPAAQVAGQPQPVVTVPAFVEFVLSADRVTDEPNDAAAKPQAEAVR